MKNKHNQQGFSLFMVMIMMIVIALLVVVTSQSTSTESRLSTNEADRKYALSEAEVGLRAAEEFLNEKYEAILESERTTGSKLNLQFTENCQNGLCAPVENVELVRPDEGHFVISDSVRGKLTVPAWERSGAFGANSSIKVNDKTRYIIEYMGQREDDASFHDYFRVTSRAHGENANTVVTLQSYVEMTRGS